MRTYAQELERQLSATLAERASLEARAVELGDRLHRALAEVEAARAVAQLARVEAQVRGAPGA